MFSEKQRQTPLSTTLKHKSIFSFEQILGVKHIHLQMLLVKTAVFSRLDPDLSLAWGMNPRHNMNDKRERFLSLGHFSHASGLEIALKANLLVSDGLHLIRCFIYFLGWGCYTQ